MTTYLHETHPAGHRTRWYKIASLVAAALIVLSTGFMTVKTSAASDQKNTSHTEAAQESNLEQASNADAAAEIGPASVVVRSDPAEQTIRCEFVPVNATPVLASDIC